MCVSVRAHVCAQMCADLIFFLGDLLPSALRVSVTSINLESHGMHVRCVLTNQTSRSAVPRVTLLGGVIPLRRVVMLLCVRVCMCGCGVCMGICECVCVLVHMSTYVCVCSGGGGGGGGVCVCNCVCV